MLKTCPTNISRPVERKKSQIVSDILDYGLQYGVSIYPALDTPLDEA